MILTNEQIHRLVPFTGFISLEYTEISPQRVTATLARTTERSTIVLEVDLTTESGKLIARTKPVQAVLGPTPI